MNKERGFTIIELMIVIVVAAIGVALAVPSFRDIIERKAVGGAAEAAYEQLQRAKSQALKRSKPILVDFKENGTDWAIGFTDKTTCDAESTHPITSCTVEYNNDGDIDVVILNSRHEPTILRNDSVSTNHWIQIQLRGAKTNRDGVGARVKVVAGDLTQIDEVHSGRGYQSHYGTRLYFGLGERSRIDRIEVHWIGGGVDVLKDVQVDRLVTITEGKPLPAYAPAGR